MSIPRILIGATASGSGKTMITCGILQALVNRGLKVASFKCGPDYIDPMFHTKVIGTKSRNLDTFFSGENDTRYLLAKNAKDMDISVMEGVMGYYDGVGGTTPMAGAYDLARVTDTPAVLIINTRGMSLSVLPLIKGFLEYKEDSKIKGVILNQMSEMMYTLLKPQIEKELGIHVYGYVPTVKDFTIESRHLGLVMPDEVEELNKKLNGLADILEKSLELDELINLANSAANLEFDAPVIPKLESVKKPRIAVGRDEAFCFYYQDNLDLLVEMGAELVEFSPIHDDKLPDGVDGLILGGGYPELFAKELSENTKMLASIKEAIDLGLPTLAECGGFMYLHKKMEGMDNISYPVVGVIDGEVYRTPKLNRFGYIDITAKHDQLLGKEGTALKAHEFHYFDSTVCGQSFAAKKPLRKRGWDCINGSDTLEAGFPHLYYYSNPNAAFSFLLKCTEKKGTIN